VIFLGAYGGLRAGELFGLRVSRLDLAAQRVGVVEQVVEVSGHPHSGASPREIAIRAGHSSVSVVLDRYGHLLPGSENRVDDELDRLARFRGRAVSDTTRSTGSQTKVKDNSVEPINPFHSESFAR
jgi:integrase